MTYKVNAGNKYLSDIASECVSLFMEKAKEKGWKVPKFKKNDYGFIELSLVENKDFKENINIV